MNLKCMFKSIDTILILSVEHFLNIYKKFIKIIYLTVNNEKDPCFVRLR